MIAAEQPHHCPLVREFGIGRLRVLRRGGSKFNDHSRPGPRFCRDPE